MQKHRSDEGHTWSCSFYKQLAGDLGAATVSATLVTPAVTIIDRSVAVKGRESSWLVLMKKKKMQSHRREVITEPVSPSRSPYTCTRRAQNPYAICLSSAIWDYLDPLCSDIHRCQWSRYHRQGAEGSSDRHDHICINNVGQRPSSSVERCSIRSNLWRTTYFQQYSSHAKTAPKSWSCTSSHRNIPASRLCDDLWLLYSGTQTDDSDTGWPCCSSLRWTGPHILDSPGTHAVCCHSATFACPGFVHETTCCAIV